MRNQTITQTASGTGPLTENDYRLFYGMMSYSAFIEALTDGTLTRHGSHEIS